ncbi:hypothetical protein ACLOAV_009494 [Pseudogymnoascus australis]
MENQTSPRAPIWVPIVRGVQVFLSIIVLGLSAYVIHGYYFNTLGFTIFCVRCSLLRPLSIMDVLGTKAVRRRQRLLIHLRNKKRATLARLNNLTSNNCRLNSLMSNSLKHNNLMCSRNMCSRFINNSLIQYLMGSKLLISIGRKCRLLPILSNRPLG